MSQDGPPLPTAYCAPGRQFTSALTLALKGERVAEIVEHPWLRDSTDIILVSPVALNIPLVATGAGDPVAKPALFFDLDGVLAFQPEGDILAVNARYDSTWLVADATTYPFWSMLPDDQAAWLQASRPVITANLAPDTRAIRVAQKAVKAGLDVTVCTERDAPLAALTRAWLAYWGVPGAETARVVGLGGKEAVLAPYGEGNPALLVDDNPANEALARPGVEVWAPQRPWTPQGDPPDGVTRFGDWRDLCKRLGLKK